MTLDKRHKKLLNLLYDCQEESGSPPDLDVTYVEEADGRVFVHFSGSRLSQTMDRLSFDNNFATEVVCDLFAAGYIESRFGPESRAPDLGFEQVLDLRAMAQSRAKPGKHKIPILQITDQGCKLVERKFEGA